MALTVETGAGLSNAESYISVSDANAYVAAYKGANATWDAASTSTKEIAARQATQYLDGCFSWDGVASTTTQALRWPRIGAYNENGLSLDATVPTKLAQACAEVMYLIVTGETITTNVSRGDRVKRSQVDVISIEYEDGAPQQPSFPQVNRLVAGLVISSNRVIRG